MAEPLKQNSFSPLRACFSHSVVQEKLNVHVAKTNESAASSYRRAHERKDGKTEMLSYLGLKVARAGKHGKEKENEKC